MTLFNSNLKLYNQVTSKDFSGPPAALKTFKPGEAIIVVGKANPNSIGLMGNQPDRYQVYVLTNKVIDDKFVVVVEGEFETLSGEVLVYPVKVKIRTTVEI